ncbi:MAG: polyphosphate kinase [Flavobacteriales bacterium]|nr:polyphosphate kinase [Flavobacteriales bacterium]
MNLKIADLPTRAPEDLDKNSAKEETKNMIKEIIERQRILYAQKKYSMLVIFQGLDASGKDGVARKVFGPLNQNGCTVKYFKKPTEKEFAHDFLWRVHDAVPEKGQIKIFNRSHYEDILVPSVYGYIDAETINKRYEHINNFERLLLDNNTLMLKFFLNVSYDEQEVRLKERIDLAHKHWKHGDGDWETRKHWDEFMKVYERIFEKCSNPVPWHMVPSDQNWYKAYYVAKETLKMLKELPLKWPELETELFK